VGLSQFYLCSRKVGYINLIVNGVVELFPTRRERPREAMADTHTLDIREAHFGPEVAIISIHDDACRSLTRPFFADTETSTLKQ